MHCFEFRELLQAQRQKWLPQPHATIDAVETRALMAIPECRELEEIDAALARIGNGSYGICSDCGGGIGRDRLKTEPTARRCPPCEARQAQIDPGAGQLPAAWPNLDIAFDRELQ